MLNEVNVVSTLNLTEADFWQKRQTHISQKRLIKMRHPT